MHYFTIPSSPSLLFFPHHNLFHLTPPFSPSLFFSLRSITTTKRLHVHLHLQEGKPLIRKKKKEKKGLCCKDWDDSTGEEGGFSPLEAEILEFMWNSKNPRAFPTREELVAAGRVDLAEAIVRRGGWLAFGWDLDRGSGESHDFDDGGRWSGEIDGKATRASGVASSSSSSSSSSQPAKSV